MKLFEFVLLTTDELDSFNEWWLEESKKDPDNFPCEMGEGDWYEQYRIYIESK